MSWLSVAAYSFTGTLTRPKDTAPFQMARMGSSDREYGVRSPSWRKDARRCRSRRRTSSLGPTAAASLSRGQRRDELERASDRDSGEWDKMEPCGRCSPPRQPAFLPG